MKLILHPRLAEQIRSIAKKPPHAVLLGGEQGVGKGSIARQIASQLLGIQLEDLQRYPYFRLVTPDDKKTISIEAIRGLQQFLRLKTTGQPEIRRVVIVEQIEQSTHEAQNAFLKTLEEPPADTVIILTCHVTQGVLSTIRSRIQEVLVQPPSANDLQAFFQQQYPAKAVGQAYFLSGGLPGLMHALLTADEQHPLQRAVQQAKELLQQSPFERLVQIDTVKQKPEAMAVCQALQRMATVTIAQAGAQHNDAGVDRWRHILQTSLDTAQALTQNANVKLALTDLCLQL